MHYGTGLSSPLQREAVTHPSCLLLGDPALLGLDHTYPVPSYSPAPPQACPGRKETVSKQLLTLGPKVIQQACSPIYCFTEQ